MQGCPFASLLFDAAVEPILCRLGDILDRTQNVLPRACADDIGIALSSISSLIGVSEVFDRCEGLTGLTLHVVKCVLVPTNRKFPPQLVEIIRD